MSARTCDSNTEIESWDEALRTAPDVVQSLLSVQKSSALEGAARYRDDCDMMYQHTRHCNCSLRYHGIVIMSRALNQKPC
mmetsp:Transcript_14731/g.39461  ORF Transcript_14731/g.39461 Transcript_14731/m.39461 type:complete len:80 (-) Transcript_14731:689-928(-)